MKRVTFVVAVAGLALALVQLLAPHPAAADTRCSCVFTDRDLFTLAGPNEPSCSGPNPDGGAGEVWGWHCGSPAGPFRVLMLDACALQVLR